MSSRTPASDGLSTGILLIACGGLLAQPPVNAITIMKPIDNLNFRIML
jgi:hypothetical protein